MWLQRYFIFTFCTIAVTLALILSIIIIIYGFYFNNVKLATAILTSLLAFYIIEFLFEPVCCLIISAFSKRNAASGKQEIYYTRSRDEQLHRMQIYYLQLRHHCYCHAFENTEEEVKKRGKFESFRLRFYAFQKDLLQFALYFVLLLLIASGTRDYLSFYRTDYSKKFSDTNVFAEISLERLHNKADLWDFLRLNVAENFYEGEGWIQERMMKVLGVLRMRQLRVKPTKDGKYPEFSLRNEDTNAYGPGWKPGSRTNWDEVYWRLLTPWYHESAWESQTLPLLGSLYFYPGGGYISNLGRTKNNTLKVLKYLENYNWVDRQTRVVFVEYTFYGQDSHLFSVVTLMLEQTIYGSYVTSSFVQTAKLLFTVENMSGFTVLVFIMFLVLTMVFVVRLVMEAVRNGLGVFREFWTIIDVLIVTLSFIYVVFFFLRNSYVRHILQKLDMQRHNQFTGFYFASFYDTLLSYGAGFLIAIATIRLWKILGFFSLFRNLIASLGRAAMSLITTTVIMVIFWTGFGLAVFVVNGSNSEIFSGLIKTLTSLAALSFGFTEEIDVENLMHGGLDLGYFFYAIQLITINIYLTNMFITILCAYFTEVKEATPHTYPMAEFIRSYYQRENYHKSKFRDHDWVPDVQVPRIISTIANETLNSQLEYIETLSRDIDGIIPEDDTVRKLDSCDITYRPTFSDSCVIC